MGAYGARALAGEIHVVKSMAIATLKRIVGLKARPFVLREFKPLVFKFLFRADRAEDLAPNLLRSLELPGKFVRPVVRNVTVGALCAHPAAIAEVDRVLQFGVHVGPHFVATNAKRFGVRHFEGSIEPSPEQDAGDESANGQEAQAVIRTWPSYHKPVAFEQGNQAAHRL